MTAWPNQEVPFVLLVPSLASSHTTQVLAQGGPRGKTHFFQTTLLTCSKKAQEITLCKKYSGLQRVSGWGGREEDGGLREGERKDIIEVRLFVELGVRTYPAW